MRLRLSVDKCKGVPLALRAIGKVLYKRTEAEWVKVNKNVHKYLTHEEEGIMPILKLSYDHLPSHLKQCFAYCSLVPKDTSFFGANVDPALDGLRVCPAPK